MNIKAIYALMMLTFKEGVRDRAIYGISLFAVMMMFGSMIIMNFFMRELYKVAIDINVSSISLAGLMLTFFVSINLLSKDIDKHTIYCVLSRPYSRTQYIVGKFLGIMLIMIAAYGILLTFSSLTLWVTKIQYATWFKAFSWISFYKAIYADFLKLMLLNALVVFFTTITSSSFITLLFSVSTYIAGETIEEVVLYLKTDPPEMVMKQSVQPVIDIVQYLLPNLSIFDLKIKASHDLVISWTYMGAITLYGIIYSAVLLIAASIIFYRRELV
jgi:ABC-type transport system involved in multi-copper enzyme maturation permease subunit